MFKMVEMAMDSTLFVIGLVLTCMTLLYVGFQLRHYIIKKDNKKKQEARRILY